MNKEELINYEIKVYRFAKLNRILDTEYATDAEINEWMELQRFFGSRRFDNE